MWYRGSTGKVLATPSPPLAFPLAVPFLCAALVATAVLVATAPAGVDESAAVAGAGNSSSASRSPLYRVGSIPGTLCLTCAQKRKMHVAALLSACRVWGEALHRTHPRMRQSAAFGDVNHVVQQLLVSEALHLAEDIRQSSPLLLRHVHCVCHQVRSKVGGGCKSCCG